MPGEAVSHVGDQRAALLGFLAGVSGNAWDAPTRCAGWSVKDVIAHLVEGELNAGRVFRGEVSELGFVDAEEGVGRWRALPGEAVRGALWQHGTATQRVLEAMTPEAWERPIRAFGCRTLRQLVRLQLFEGVVHSHDLTDALGAQPVWGDRVALVAEHCVRAAPGTFARLGFEPSGALGVRVSERTWLIDGRDGTWAVRLDADPAGATATLEADPADLVLATTGRMPLAAFLARATVAGDRGVVEGFLGAWQVVARPPQGVG